MRVCALAALVVVVASGCDTLFPEFAGKPSDMATNSDAGDAGTSDGGSSAPHITGVVCVLSDLRDYRSCTNGNPGNLRITVEETRDVAMTDATGHFTLPLTRTLAGATLAAVDPLGRYAPSIVPLVLPSGMLDAVAIPVVEQAVVANAAAQNGVNLDDQHGTVLAWAVDKNGTPVANVSATSTIWVDGSAPNQLYPAAGTGSHGTVALLNVPPSSVTVTLTPPPASQLAGDKFNLPVRFGAVTASRLILLPR
jgi:hypothetical protein